ncbi:jg21823, partial [Pararge aegeria aegeria]
ETDGCQIIYQTSKYGTNKKFTNLGQRCLPSAIDEYVVLLGITNVLLRKVFCCHGGIPPPWVCPLVSAIDKIPTPLPRPHDQSAIAWELLWNDPV